MLIHQWEKCLPSLTLNLDPNVSCLLGKIVVWYLFCFLVMGQGLWFVLVVLGFRSGADRFQNSLSQKYSPPHHMTEVCPGYYYFILPYGAFEDQLKFKLITFVLNECMKANDIRSHKITGWPFSSVNTYIMLTRSLIWLTSDVIMLAKAENFARSHFLFCLFYWSMPLEKTLLLPSYRAHRHQGWIGWHKGGQSWDVIIFCLISGFALSPESPNFHHF